MMEEVTYAPHARIASYSVHPWMWSCESLVRILCTCIVLEQLDRGKMYSRRAGHDLHVIVVGLIW